MLASEVVARVGVEDLGSEGNLLQAAEQFDTDRIVDAVVNVGASLQEPH